MTASPVMIVTGGGRGYAVCVNYLGNAAAAEAVAGDIEETGGRAIAVQADVASEAEVERVFAAVDRELGPLTALVNNAGLAREVAREGVRVNGVAPGFIKTGIHAASGMPDRLETVAPTMPMGRAAEPEEIAETILWLLSEAASYTTGATLRVAGGR